MNCPNCGRKNKDGAKFCAGCGAPLQSTAAHKDAATGRNLAFMISIIASGAADVALGIFMPFLTRADSYSQSSFLHISLLRVPQCLRILYEWRIFSSGTEQERSETAFVVWFFYALFVALIVAYAAAFIMVIVRLVRHSDKLKSSAVFLMVMTCLAAFIKGLIAQMLYKDNYGDIIYNIDAMSFFLPVVLAILVLALIFYYLKGWKLAGAAWENPYK